MGKIVIHLYSLLFGQDWGIWVLNETMVEIVKDNALIYDQYMYIF